MSNLGRIRRLLELLEALQSECRLTSHDLADLFRVSRRTIMRDIKTLRDCGIGIIYDSEQRSYCVPVPTVDVAFDWTQHEFLAVFLLCYTLGHGRTGIPFQQDARQAALKLTHGAPRSLRRLLKRVAERVDIQCQSPAGSGGQESVYRILLRGTTFGHCVRIVYSKPGDDGLVQTLLSPYRLAFRDGGWFVVGRSSVHRAVATFDLPGIQQAEPVENRSFDVPAGFRLSRHLRRDSAAERRVVSPPHVAIPVHRAVAE